MEDISVSDLPGVGRATSYKLSSMGIKTCQDLQQVPLAKMQAEFGVKSGDSLYKHCRGKDDRKLVFGQIRKSVSAEVNYGIRFQNAKEVDTFLRELSQEVHTRLQEVNMKTKLITLKLMMRAADAPVETAKFLGHGVCDQVSRSSTLLAATSDLETITREVVGLNRQLNIEPTDMRGIGIQLSKLESGKPAKPIGNVIDKFLRPKGEINNTVEKNIETEKQTLEISNKTINNKPSTSAIDNFFVVKKHASNQSKQSTVKPMDIDKEVLEALPEDIRKEVMLEYGLTPSDLVKGGNPKQTEPSDKPTAVGEDESSNSRLNSYNYGINYSQIDPEVFDELPSEIKREIESAVPRKKEKVDLQLREDHNQAAFPEVNSNETKLDQNLSPAEVRALIKAWTSAEDSPQPCDVDMLAGYLQGLVSSRQLDSLDVCVSCLHRCIEKRGNPSWQEAYHSIISNLQPVMVAEYGLRLSVPKLFKT